MTAPIPTTAHNQAIAGDTLGSVSFNYQWRQLIVDALQWRLAHYARSIADETDRQTFENRVTALIDDIYDLETVASMTIGAKVRSTSNQTIFTASGEVYATFHAADFDTDSFWSGIGNPTKLIVPTGLDGLYLVEGSGLNSNISGNRTMSIWKNSSREAKAIELAETQSQGSLSVVLDLVAGDEIRLSFTSSTNSTLISSSNDSAWLSLIRLGDAP